MRPAATRGTQWGSSVGHPAFPGVLRAVEGGVNPCMRTINTCARTPKRLVRFPGGAPRPRARRWRRAPALTPAFFGVARWTVARGRRRVHRAHREHDRGRGHLYGARVHDTPAEEEPTAAEEQQHPAYHTLSLAQVMRDAWAVRPEGEEAYSIRGTLPPGFVAGHRDNPWTRPPRLRRSVARHDRRPCDQQVKAPWARPRSPRRGDSAPAPGRWHSRRGDPPRPTPAPQSCPAARLA